MPGPLLALRVALVSCTLLGLVRGWSCNDAGATTTMAMNWLPKNADPLAVCPDGEAPAAKRRARRARHRSTVAHAWGHVCGRVAHCTRLLLPRVCGPHRHKGGLLLLASVSGLGSWRGRHLARLPRRRRPVLRQCALRAVRTAPLSACFPTARHHRCSRAFAAPPLRVARRRAKAPCLSRPRPLPLGVAWRVLPVLSGLVVHASPATLTAAPRAVPRARRAVPSASPPHGHACAPPQDSCNKRFDGSAYPHHSCLPGGSNFSAPCFMSSKDYPASCGKTGAFAILAWRGWSSVRPSRDTERGVLGR